MRGFLPGVIAVLVLLLAACGFQPRGQAQLPPELAVLYIQSQTAIATPPGLVSRKLRTLLASSGVTVVSDPAQATATLVVLRESDGRRAVSADRFDVKREYILAYDVSYEVRLGNGKVLLPAESLIANRALLFDENQVLGFEAAQEVLANSMAEDLAWQIIRRLQALKS
jgi:LPS-assembly lipoprotein